MPTVDQFPLRVLGEEETPVFTPECSITDDRRFILVPKSESGTIHIIPTADYSNRNAILLRSRSGGLIHPMWTTFAATPGSAQAGRFLIADTEGTVWVAPADIENFEAATEVYAEPFFAVSDWHATIRREGISAGLSIWKVVTIQREGKLYAFLLGYSDISDVRGCVIIVEMESRSPVASLYPIDEAPADIAFAMDERVILIAIATGRGGIIERYRCANDFSSITKERPITHPEMLVPSRIKVDPRGGLGFWVVSFNRLFRVLPEEDRVDVLVIAQSADGIPDFDFHQEGTPLYAACLMSNTIVSVETRNYATSIISQNEIPQPCWIRVGIQNSIFVLGHSTETVSVVFPNK